MALVSAAPETREAPTAKLPWRPLNDQPAFDARLVIECGGRPIESRDSRVVCVYFPQAKQWFAFDSFSDDLVRRFELAGYTSQVVVAGDYKASIWPLEWTPPQQIPR